MSSTPSPTLAHVLLPKRLSLRARASVRTPEARTRWIGLILFGIVFWSGAFSVLRRMLRYFANAPDLGPLLAAKLFGLIFLGFVSILLLSNVISALSSFFLSRDLDLLVAAPVRWPTLYVAKLLETTVASSWMVVLMTVPIFAAYGVVLHGGFGFPLLAALVLVPYFILPAAVGSAITLLLVNVFPARRARNVLSVVAPLAAAGLVVLIRLMRPERLARPEGFASLTGYLAALETPTAPWMPSEWATRAVMTWLHGGWSRTDWPAMALLWGTAALAVAAGALLHRACFARGFSRSQVAGIGGGVLGEASGRTTAWARVTRRLVHLVPMRVERRALVAKELRVFFRDTTQWSQLILLAVLVVVYVFNIRFLPLTDDRLSVFLRNVVPFFNLLLAGFVLASIAARFIFPAVSLEGRTLWLLRSSPLRVDDLLWAKYWVGTLPLLVLAVGIVAVTDAMLEVTPFMFYVSVLTILLMTFALAALALCIGTVFPRFETENPAQIPTSFGGLVYMMSAVLLIGAVIVCEAGPVSVYLIGQMLHAPRGGVGEMAGGFGLAAALCVAGTLIPIRVARRKLAASERAG